MEVGVRSSPALLSRNRVDPPGIEVSRTWARAGHRYREINTSSRYGGTYQKDALTRLTAVTVDCPDCIAPANH